MSAGNYDIYIEQGATFFMTLTLKDSDGVVLDLTSHTFSGKIRRTPSEAATIASFSFNVLSQIVDATKGMVEVSIDATTTAAIAADTSGDPDREITIFAYDIESIVGAVVTRHLEGLVEFSPECTKT